MKTYFLDFEASSLDSGSFPIEIAWVDSNNGQGESYLIKPRSIWTQWSDRSQKVHGIDRETLENEGKTADYVANRALAVLTGALLISNNPAYDEYWLDTLLLTVTTKRIAVQHLNMLIGQQIERIAQLNTHPPDTAAFWRQNRILFDEAQILVANAIENINMAHKTIHRALPDAEHLWQEWRAAKSAIDQRLRAGQSDH